MARKKGTTDALEIFDKLYVKDDPDRKAAIERESVKGDVAQMIYDLRTDAGLTQKELAELIETTQSVVSRLEDADYEGHSLTMLRRIAKALNQKLTVAMTARDPEVGKLRYAFQMLLEKLRRSRGLTFDELAKKADIDRNEIMAIERHVGYQPGPRTLHKLSQFYGIPHERLAALAGAFREVPPKLAASASQFAAQSESFGKLPKEERKLLDDFVKLLKAEV